MEVDSLRIRLGEEIDRADDQWDDAERKQGELPVELQHDDKDADERDDRAENLVKPLL